MNDNIFNEVDADVRRERLQFLWARYGLLIIGGALAVVLGVAAMLGINHWVGRAQEATSVRYDALIEGLDGKPLADRVMGLQQFSAAEDNGYGALAALRAALELATSDGGDATRGLEQLDNLVNNRQLPDMVLDFARLQASIIALDMNKDSTEIEARLAPLLDENNALRPLALEILALVQLMGDNPLKARELYQQVLQEPRATALTRERVAIMLYKVNKNLSPDVANDLGSQINNENK